MSKPKFLFSAAILFAFVLITGLSVVSAQEGKQEVPAEASYEVVLQTLIATNDVGSREQKLPAELNETVRKLRETFSFGEYSLIATHLELVGGSGSISYKSLFDQLAPYREETIILSWELNDLKRQTGAGGEKMIGFNSFRYDLRIPIKTNTVRSDGRTIPVVNYESAGLNLRRFNISENKPTLIGTLSMPKMDGMIFFVLTVRPN